MSRKVPTVTLTNYTSIFTKPIFQNQNGEWYKDVGYEDSIDIIRDNFVEARKSFVAIGYYLKHIKEKELYKEGNYQNIWECAEGEFGLSASAASNYMKMNDAYSVNGDTPILDEKYKGFSKSQLQEMLALTEKKREEIQPEQTVREIREIAKEEKKIADPSEKEVRYFYEHYVKKDMDNELRSAWKIELQKKYKNAGGSNSFFDWKGSARGIKINKADEITWAQLVRLINQYYPKKKEDKREDEKEEQLEGQMNIADYPNIMPDNTDETKQNIKKEIPNPGSECPPGINQCIRQEWGLTEKQQDAGKKECTECWKKWEENKKQNTVMFEALEENIKKVETKEEMREDIKNSEYFKQKNIEENRMEILYELLNRAYEEKDERTACVLKWAIFTLENAI